jgi:hypothetical protein
MNGKQRSQERVPSLLLWRRFFSCWSSSGFFLLSLFSLFLSPPHAVLLLVGLRSAGQRRRLKRCPSLSSRIGPVAVVSSTIFISAQLCTLRVPLFLLPLFFVLFARCTRPHPLSLSLSLASAVLVAPPCPLFAFHSHKHCATSLKTSQFADDENFQRHA